MIENKKTNELFDSTKTWTALITPFTQNGQIDWTALLTLIKQQNQAKNGILCLGSTGEALALDMNEKKKYIELITSMKLDVPIMVGVGGIHLSDTLNWIGYLESQPNISSYLLVTPLYAKPKINGQVHWFTQLLNKSSRPCLLYNVPSRTGASLDLHATVALKDHPNFWGIKESSGDINQFFEYQKALPKQRIYCGEDVLMPYLGAARASGLVSVASNVWPIETNKYVELCLNQQGGKCLPIWHYASKSLFCSSNPIPVKYLMYQLKMIETPFVRPPLSEDDMPEQNDLITTHHSVKSWFENL